MAPALGTPSSGNLANCSFPTLNQNTTGNAATATNPQSGGSFITSSNIGSQSVNFATTAGNGGVTSVNGQTGAVVTTTYGGIGSYVIAGTTDQPGAGEYLNAGTTVAGSTLVRYNPILADQPSYAGVLGGLQVFDNFFVARTFLEYYSESLGLTGTWRIMTSIILGTGGQGGPGGWNATNGKYLLALFVRIS